MMLTRCPACQTVFRLRPEQVQARHGEVRCGHCFNPFNALTHQIGESTETPPEPVEAKAETPVPQAPPQAAPATQPSLSDLDFEVPDSLLPERQEPVWSRPAPAPVQEEEPAFDAWQPAPAAPVETHIAEIRLEPAVLAPDTQEAPPPAFRVSVPAQMPPLPKLQDYTEPTLDEPEQASAPEPSLEAPPPAPEVIRSERRPYPGRRAAQRAEPGEPAPLEAVAEESSASPVPEQLASETEAEPVEDVQDLKHLDRAYGPAPGSHAVQRTVLGLLSTVLAIGLAAQAIYIFRLDIARELPGLRPLLVAACQRLDCAMPLPQAADKINVNAELQSEPGRPGRYILYATVKNHAAYTQAWPHLELTLTDGGDNPMVRRVLAPEEWAPPERLPSGLPGRGDISLRLPFDAPGLVPTGYRVYLFYP